MIETNNPIDISLGVIALFLSTEVVATLIFSLDVEAHSATVEDILELSLDSPTSQVKPCD